MPGHVPGKEDEMSYKDESFLSAEVVEWREWNGVDEGE